jgi:hypothetical protein
VGREGLEGAATPLNTIAPCLANSIGLFFPPMRALDVVSLTHLMQLLALLGYLEEVSESMSQPAESGV